MKKISVLPGVSGGRSALIPALLIILMAACSPDKNSVSLGTLPKASFTITPVTGAVNTFVLTGTSAGVFSWSWDPGDGTGSKLGAQTDTVYYAKKGLYKTSLLVLNKAGYDTTSQVLTVASDDPGINVLQGSALDAASQQYWTVLNTGGTQTAFAFTAQGLNISNTGNTNGGIYQAVTVKAGVQYTFSVNVQGAGATNSWVEVYLGATVPVQGSDYTDNKFNSLNTWSGCGGSSFNGNLSDIGCSGTGVGAGGKIKFTASGTIYLVIKAGSSGGTLGTGGITFSNIALTEPSH